ncbi:MULTISPECIES: ABC transporter substrate-binding protein [unclassified Salinibacterium]|uniref:ABC transporter substrate-binding protein n=1 Tax=unclassified Salinibacterium TaxID=2632331 RepID=UPI00142347DF|nr:MULTISPECIES: ABC transporter substrate-binding protein [unclassified Salinibacterium]
MKRSLLVGIAAVSVFALAACSNTTEPSGDETAADGELTAITVGIIPIVDTAPLHLGVEQGFFEEEGLDVTIESGAGGAALIPGVISGDFDFAFGNYVSSMVARDKGLDIVYVANGNSTTGDPTFDFSGVLVNADSDIQSPADLAGKRVSVNTLANIGDTTIRQVVEDDGGDPESIEFVEIPFPDAPAALANGQVDAAWILDPFMTSAIDAGARVVTYNFADFDENLDVSGYFTSGDQLEAEADTVEAFKTAMNRSLEFAQENPDEVRRIVTTYTEIPADVLERIALPRFNPEFNREAIAKLGAAATKYGTLSEEPNLDELLQP